MVDPFFSCHGQGRRFIVCATGAGWEEATFIPSLTPPHCSAHRPCPRSAFRMRPRSAMLGPLPVILFMLLTRIPSPCVLASPASQRLSLSPINAINAFGVPVSGGGSRNVEGLLDEQQIAGDPAAGKGGDVTSMWMPGYEEWYYPWVNAVIDLGAEYDLDQVRCLPSPRALSLCSTLHAASDVRRRVRSIACQGLDVPQEWELRRPNGLR